MRYKVKSDPKLSKETLAELLKIHNTVESITTVLFPEVSSETARSRFHSAIRYYELNEEFLVFKKRDLLTRNRITDPALVLVKNSNISQSALRDVLLRYKVFPYSCVHCGLEGWYNGKKLNLHVDHISGDNKNNEIANLRYLCPNCHSQTTTYCRGKKDIGKNRKKCVGCGSYCVKNHSKVKMCRDCYRKSQGGANLIKLTVEELTQLVVHYSMQEICKLFKTSYLRLNEVLKEHSIKKTPYGDWTSIRSRFPMDPTYFEYLSKKYDFITLGK